MEFKTKFRSTSPFNDLLQFMSKQGLTIIALGAMVVTVGVVFGAIVCTGKSIAGGIMILFTLIVTGLAIIYHGMIGISKTMHKNRTLSSAEYKEITVDNCTITEEQKADGYMHSVTTTFNYVDRVIKNNGIYQFFLSGGLLLLAKEGDLIEGDLSALNTCLSSVFGDRFINKDLRRLDKSRNNSSDDSATSAASAEPSDTAATDTALNENSSDCHDCDNLDTACGCNDCDNRDTVDNK